MSICRAAQQLVPIVTQSQTELHERLLSSVHTNWRKCLHYFLLSENVLNYKIGTKMFYVAYRTLLVMFCVLKYILWTLMECLHLFKAAKFGSLKMHVLCKVGKNIIFQNKTFLVMFYRQNKTFWYQFCNFKHFLKAESSEDRLASS